MAKNKQKKQKLSITPNPSPGKPVKKPKKSKKKTTFEKSKSKPENIQTLLEPYSKEQLIDLAIESALLNPTLISKIQEVADSDTSHRKIFVHGLCWSTTNESLNEVFGKFGEIQNCNLVKDKATGRAKGFAFITYKSRKSALKVLKQPKKVVNNRVVGCNLSSTGPQSSTTMQEDVNVGENRIERKIYVTNVTSEVDPERLRRFFSSFGEIESGPTGFDPNTGKFRGYALFVYKTLEGSKKALEEPRKVFEGRQLHCQKASEGKTVAGGAAGITTSVQPVPSGYAAIAGGQNVGLLAQNPPNASINGGLLTQNPNASIHSGLMSFNAANLFGNPNPASGLINVNPYGGYGGYGQVPGGIPMGIGMGIGGYNQMLGSYGSVGVGQQVMQGYMNAYPSTSTAPKSSYGGPTAISGQPFR